MLIKVPGINRLVQAKQIKILKKGIVVVTYDHEYFIPHGKKT